MASSRDGQSQMMSLRVTPELRFSLLEVKHAIERERRDTVSNTEVLEELIKNWNDTRVPA